MVAVKLDLLRAGDMQDQRIVRRAALDLKDLRNGSFVQTVGTQTVNGLRGNGHQAAVFDNFRRPEGSIRRRGG